jgi:hypothetical protein
MMWNPFRKHEEEHDDVAYLLAQLTLALADLTESVKELREEVDYLAEFLND